MKKFLLLLMLFTIGVPVYAGKGHSKENLYSKESLYSKLFKVILNLSLLNFSPDCENDKKCSQKLKTLEEKQKKKSNKK